MNYTKLRVIIYDKNGNPFQVAVNHLSITRKLNGISTGTLTIPNTRGQFDPDNPNKEAELFGGQKISIQRIDYVNGKMSVFDIFQGKIDHIGGISYANSTQTVQITFVDAWKWAKIKKTTDYFENTDTNTILSSILDDEGIEYSLTPIISQVSGVQFVKESILDIVNEITQVNFLAWAFDGNGKFKTYAIGTPVQLQIPTFNIKSFSPQDSQWDIYTEVDVKGKSKDELNQAQDFGEQTGTATNGVDTTIEIHYSTDDSIKAKDPVVNWISPSGFTNFSVVNDASQTFCTVTITNDTGADFDYDFTLSATVINRGTPFYSAKYADSELETQVGSSIPWNVSNHVITDNDTALSLAKKLLAFSKFKRNPYSFSIAGMPIYNDFLSGYSFTLTHPKFNIPITLIITGTTMNFTPTAGFSTTITGVKEGEWYA